MNPNPAEFMTAMRATRDPNWSDIEHLLRLVWRGDVIAAPSDSMAADNAIGNLRSHGYEIDALLRQRDRGEL